MELGEWAVRYVEYKNSFSSQDIQTTISDNSIECTDINSKKVFLIEDTLGSDIFEKMWGQVTIICLNTKHNLNFLIKNWTKLRKNPKLIVIFANPSSNLQWTICPYTHHQVADNKTLEIGLKAMFITIPEVQ